jgi:hypothetical protein
MRVTLVAEDVILVGAEHVVGVDGVGVAALRAANRRLVRVGISGWRRVD